MTAVRFPGLQDYANITDPAKYPKNPTLSPSTVKVVAIVAEELKISLDKPAPEAKPVKDGEKAPPAPKVEKINLVFEEPDSASNPLRTYSPRVKAYTDYIEEEKAAKAGGKLYTARQVVWAAVTVAGYVALAALAAYAIGQIPATVGGIALGNTAGLSPATIKMMAADGKVVAAIGTVGALAIGALGALWGMNKFSASQYESYNKKESEGVMTGVAKFVAAIFLPFVNAWNHPAVTTYYKDKAGAELDKAADQLNKFVTFCTEKDGKRILGKFSTDLVEAQAKDKESGKPVEGKLDAEVKDPNVCAKLKAAGISDKDIFNADAELKTLTGKSK